MVREGGDPMSPEMDPQVEAVVAGLRRRYEPLVGAEAVEAAVAEAVDHFKDARVREHLPVLIERRARAALDGRR
jgi:hypothetical protein